MKKNLNNFYFICFCIRYLEFAIRKTHHLKLIINYRLLTDYFRLLSKMANNNVMILSCAPHNMFSNDGQLRGYIKDHFNKNNNIKPEEETKRNYDINGIEIFKKNNNTEQTTGFAKFKKEHGLKIVCASGLAIGGLFGLAGAAAVVGIIKAHKALKKYTAETNETKDNKETKVNDEYSVEVAL